jgi:hypothetical protein
MSLRSLTKRSNAASMAELSVLASTTRKFFCESGAGVTCWCGFISCVRVSFRVQGWLTPTPASSMPVTVSSSPMTARNWRSLYCAVEDVMASEVRVGSLKFGVQDERPLPSSWLWSSWSELPARQNARPARALIVYGKPQTIAVASTLHTANNGMKHFDRRQQLGFSNFLFNLLRVVSRK